LPAYLTAANKSGAILLNPALSFFQKSLFLSIFSVALNPKPLLSSCGVC